DAILNAAWACGGLVGGVTTSATLSECFSQAEVDGGRVYLTGGLVGGQPGGKHTAADFVIENSYSAGSVSGYRYVGGLTGGTTGVDLLTSVVPIDKISTVDPSGGEY
ncbi:unnamed protein product, partial [Didymodactylos carnosus]